MIRHALPIALPNETLYGVVSRLGKPNGLSDQDVCEFLFGDQDNARVSDAIADVGHFCHATEGAYGKPKDVLDMLTLWPFFRNMATHPLIESPIEEPTHSRVARLPSTLSLTAISNWQPNVWRLCHACRAQDIETYGHAYWHRTHQLPGVAICLTHGALLHEARIPYWSRQKGFLELGSPGEYLNTNSLDMRSDSIDHVLQLAHFASEALAAEDCGLSASVVRGVFLDALGTMGLTNRSGAINQKDFTAAFLSHYKALSGASQFSSSLNPKSLARVAKGLSVASVMIAPILSLMMATWIFESWERFRAYCQWRATLDAPASDLPLESPRPSSERNRREHRQTCLEFKASSPAASRTDFWHAYPKACRWLAQYDSEWLECRLPIAKEHAPKQFALF